MSLLGNYFILFDFNPTYYAPIIVSAFYLELYAMATLYFRKHGEQSNLYYEYKINGNESGSGWVDLTIT